MSSFNLIDVVELLNKANNQGVKISLDEDKLKIKMHKDQKIDSSLLDELKLKKEYIITYFKKHGNSALVSDENKITAFPRESVSRIPLSSGQERLWFLDQLEGSTAYHIPTVLRLRGKLDKNALESALKAIVNRHEVLRTVIEEEGGLAYQRILPENGWKMNLIDDLIYRKDEQALRTGIKELTDAPFDLSKDHMLRAYLIVLGEEEFVLSVTMHHIASDGWSAGIIVNELIECYNAVLENRKPELPVLELQYADYALWQRERYSVPIQQQHLDYWKNNLGGVSNLYLPADFPRPAMQSVKGAVLEFQLDQAVSEELHALSRRHDATIFMTLLTAFKILLYRYTGQDDICVGTPTAGRTLQELEGLVGFFVNTLALRTDLSAQPDFLGLLQQVKDTTLNAYEHQDLPLEKIVDAVVKERDLSRNPLFQVCFSLLNIPEDADLKFNGVALSSEPMEHSKIQFDFTLTMRETSKGLVAAVEYCTELYREETISRMIGHFKTLLDAIIANPETKITELQFLSKAEEEQLLFTFNRSGLAVADGLLADDLVGDDRSLAGGLSLANGLSLPEGSTIVDQFAAQVEKTPDARAVIYEGQSISYKSLDEQANQLAHYLQIKGVSTESLVPVFMNRSLEMMVGILGILKAGGAYVPIDPEYPATRISYILNDIAASVVITDQENQSKLSHLPDHVELIVFEEVQEEISAHAKSPLKTMLTDENLAYVIYTSGSTGIPKGVLVLHRNVVSLVKNVSYVTLTQDDVLLSTGSASFDATTFEYWGMLLNGGQLILCPENKLLDSSLLKAEIRRHGVTKMWFTSSWFNQLIDTDISVFEGLSVILAGGEKLSDEHVYRMRKTYPEIALINGYGPTENTTFSLTYPITDSGHIPIGRPLDHRTAYVLDARLNPVPIGVSGEIYLGGAGLSRGYLNRPELTAERFVAHPFIKSERLYRSGDLGRWLPDGTIDFLGRIDDQVKIRGYRIELGEIENVLEQSGLLKQVVVLAKADAQGNKRLIAYVVPVHEFDRELLISYLKDKLPAYMVPALWVALEEMPLTQNGKTDKNALPEPGDVLVSSSAYIPPRNPTEQVLTAIWQDLLGIAQVGIYDNFFELGGDSIITIQVVSRAKRAGYELQPKDLFIYQTVEKLSALLMARKSAELTAEQGHLAGTAGLLPIQQWFFEDAGPNPSHFNQQVLLSIDKNTDIALLRSAIAELSHYHDALRLSYSSGLHGWEQHYGTELTELELADVQHLQPEQLNAEIEKHCDRIQRSLDLEQGIVFRALLLLTPESDAHYRLFFAGHHLVVDGVSWRILLEDLGLLLQHPEQPAAMVLGAKTSSYRQWYTALNAYGQRRRLLAQLPYWEKSMQEYHPLKTTQTGPDQLTVADTKNYTASLSAAATKKLLQEVPKAYHTEINDVLLCALALTFADWNEHPKVSIGLEGHGREDILEGLDTSRTIGWFTSMYPVLLEVKAGQPIGAQLKAVKEQLRAVPDKGLGYGVLKYLNKESTLEGKAPWDLIFNYLGQVGHALNGEEELDAGVENTGAAADEAFPVREKLSVNSVIQGGSLSLTWTYSDLHFATAEIEGLSERYLFHLEALIAHCSSGTEGSFSPSDFNLTGIISIDELDAFLQEEHLGVPRSEGIERIYKLSGLQEGMLFHSIYDEEAGAYVEQFMGEITDLNVAAFLQSWEYLLAHHSILRSSFHYDRFSIPLQCVYSEVELPLTMLDYRDMEPADQQKAVKAYEVEAKRKGFDFTKAPLMNLTLIRLSDRRHRMLWNFHHMLLDGWSIPVLLEKLLMAYETLIAGESLALIAKDNYEDYIRYTERRDKEEEELYWRSYLKGLSEGCLLPFVNTTVNRNKGLGLYRELPLIIDARISAQLFRFAQRHRVTVNTLIQGVWAYLLYRYTGRPDVVFGVTVSGRPEDLPGVERAIGMYINTLPLYTVIDPEAGIVQWLQELQMNQLQSREYQYTPLNITQRFAKVEGDLFDSLIVYENYPASKVVDGSSDHLELENASLQEQTNYPLSLIVSASEEIGILFSYNSTLLEDDYVRLISGHFEQVLHQLLVYETGTLAEIDMLKAAEQAQLADEFNATTVVYPHTETAISLFETQVLLSPDAKAIVFEDQVYTYKELDERANQLARYLRGKGVGTDSLVPVCLERSEQMAVAILGIMKAGAAYVPIDPAYPSERISFMLEDTQATVVVSSAELKASTEAFATLDAVLIDADWELIQTWGGRVPAHPAGPGDLAYVIYTSGSTGKPKGVMIEHAGMLNHLYAKINELQLNEHTVVAFTASYTFDISVWQLFSALLVGGTTVIYSSAKLLEPAELIGAVEKDGITILELVPSYLTAVLQENISASLQQLRYLLVTGEAVSQPLLAQWFAHKAYGRIPVVNAYGPTEASDDICHHIMHEAPERINVPVGKPVQNMRIYVVSSSGQLCPVGVPGEICVSGIGVARGYLNRPDLTASRFVSCSFEAPENRMYRTGDLGRWLSDGTIDYLGRIDDQVKIRGFRIELGEIETVIQQAAGIIQAAVVVKTDESGNKRLVAYVVSEKTFDREQTVNWLKSQLPEYMVPGWFVAMDQLPLTGNGKIDRKNLPEPEQGALQSRSYVAPRNEQEQLLAGIWEELLHLPEVGIYDNFFELGGDSIITIQVVSRARRAGFNLHPRDLFQHQTIAGLSARLSTETLGTASGEQGKLEGTSGLLPIQQHYLESGAPDLAHYNQSVLLKVKKSVSLEKLSAGISQLVASHDALGFRYLQLENGWEQQYSNYTAALEVTDFSALSTAELGHAIEAHNDRQQASLDLEKGLVFRAVLILTPDVEAENRLLLVVHHLAVDGVSWRILLEDLELLLNGTSLPAFKTASYRQWHQALVAYGNRKKVKAQLPYWASAYSAGGNTTSSGKLKTLYQWTGVLAEKDIAEHQVSLDAELTRQLLQEAPRAYHTVINDLLLSALALTLAGWNGDSHVVIGLEGHGREDIAGTMDISRTVGWFTSLYPVVLDLSADGDTSSLLKNLKEQLRQVPDNGLGYGVLKYLDKAPALQGKDPWEVEFNYLGQMDNIAGKKEDTLISAAKESSGKSLSAAHPVRELISVNSLIQGGELQMSWSYSSRHFNAEAIATLAEHYLSHLRELISHCVSVTEPVFTPSDYHLGEEISNEELDQFLDAEYQGASRRSELESISRLSGLQKGMLFHSLYDEQAGAYSKQFTCELVGLDPDIFMQSWNALLKRHSILRSAFYYNEFKIPVQCVYRNVNIPVEILDCSHMDQEAQKRYIRYYEEEDLKKGFDFTAAPLMRIGLVKLDENRFYLLWSHHHLLLDGWSMPTLMEGLLSNYELLSEGKALPELAEDRYEHYIRYIERQDKEEARAYWKQYLEGLEEATLLPFIGNSSDRTRVHSGYGDEIVHFDATFTARLTRYAQQNRVTVNTLMQGVWSYLLYRYTGRTHVSFGIVVSGRPENLPGVESAVGMYINTLPFHGKVSLSEDISKSLQQIQSEQLESRAYQYNNLSEVQRLSGITGDLFDTLMVFENYPVSETLDAQPWKLKVENVSSEEHTNYPLSIIIVAGAEIAMNFNYNSLLSAADVKSIAGHFSAVLEQMIASEGSKFADLDIFTAASRQQLIHEFNAKSISALPDATVTARFAKASALAGLAPAIVSGKLQLSYQELDEQSSRLAHYLRDSGVGSGVLVAVCLERSAAVIISMLGILKAGGAYVPIDPAYPAERILYMLSDSGTDLLISTDQVLSGLEIPENVELIHVADFETLTEEYPVTAPEQPISLSDLVYVIYTSGSTGLPKGVEITHAGLSNLLSWHLERYELNPQSVSTAAAGIGFDAFGWEIWPVLVAGASLHLIDDELRLSPAGLVDYYEQAGVTHSFLSTVLIPEFVTESRGRDLNLKYLLAGGDRLSAISLEGLGYKIVNNYGPTENSVVTSSYELIAENSEQAPPIGIPVSHTQVYILNAANQLSPVGVPGELCISGAGLARGYLNRPELTAEKFVPNPFFERVAVDQEDGVVQETAVDQKPAVDQKGVVIQKGVIFRDGVVFRDGVILHDGTLPQESSLLQDVPFDQALALNQDANSRMYRSGDLARWLPDGNIEYLGRIDDQVKIRGYRIELGEIENVLQQSELVKQAVILARPDHRGHKQLVAYLVPEGDFNREALVEFLKLRLPEYMVPALWVSLEKFPLTSNGKVDRKMLPEVDANEAVTAHYEAPKNAAELALAGIWADLLRIEKVGIHDNFFELGGDSIITIQVVSRAKRAGYEFQPRDLFAHQTIARLVLALAARKAVQSQSESGFLSGKSGLLPIQQWYFDLENPAVSHFNQHVLLSVSKTIGQEALSSVIEQLSSYHDALRFTYRKTNEGWEQEYGAVSTGLSVVDLQGIPVDELADQLKLHGDQIQRNLDIEQGMIFRPVLFLTPGAESENRLLLVVHHLAVDGVSWRILLEDLSLMLAEPDAPALSVLGSKSISYRQWHQALQEYGKSGILQDQVPYWTTVVKNYIPLITDKVYFKRLTVKDTGTIVGRLSKADTQALLQEVPQAYRTEINDVLLCALTQTLSGWAGHPGISVGLEGHGREDIKAGIDTSRTVGWFTNLYPVSLKLGTYKDPGSQLRLVKEQLRSVPEKGIGYGVLKYLNKDQDLQKAEPWNILFNYLGQLDNMVTGEGLIGMAGEQAGDNVGEDYPVSDKLALNTMIQGGELILDWTYSKKHYEASTIDRLSLLYLEYLRSLIQHCKAQQELILNPSDYGLAEQVSMEELDRFMEEEVAGSTRRTQLEGIYRLGGLQEGMLFHNLYNEKGAFTEQFSCDLLSLQTDAFIRSWELILKNHSILRTGFEHEVFSIPVQCVYKEAALPFTLLDYRSKSAEEKELALAAYEQADRHRGFELNKAPLMRVCLIRLTDDRYRLLWSFHHILLDGWSVPVLLGEMISNYEALSAGKTVELQAVDRYEDYIRYLEKQDKHAIAAYWRQYLGKAEEGCLLPFVTAIADRTRGIGMKEGAIQLDARLTSLISDYAKAQHLTVNSVMQGVWAYLLYRYTGRKDIIFGVTVSGRPEDLPGIERKVGMYINTLPLYIQLDQSLSIAEWLQVLQQGQLDSREYQYTTLNDIQRLTAVRGDLFDTSIVFQNYPVSEEDMQSGAALEVSDAVVHPQTNYPLTINVITGAEINLLFVYNDEILETSAVDMMMGHFKQVLLQLAEENVQHWTDISLLTAPEKEQLLLTFNNNVVPYPQDQTFVDLFREQVQRSPEAQAIVFEHKNWSYRELDEQSDHLAGSLREKGAGPDVLVPVYLDRSPEMMIAILGIMKAGAAYVPLDTAYPAERINYILKDTNAVLIVTSTGMSHKLGEVTTVPFLMVDTEMIKSNNTELPAEIAGPGNLAYVIYTSGSTGQPKGVMVEHAGMLNHLFAKVNDLSLNPSSSVAFTASYTFDISVWQMFSALLAGGRTVIYPAELLLEPVALLEALVQDEVTILELVPSYLAALLRGNIAVKPGKLEYLLVTGEAVSQSVLKDWFGHPFYGAIPVVNAYGPTEASDDICHYLMHSAPEAINIPVGKPIQNLQVYVLDSSLDLCPLGVVGEVCVAGIGVSRGYLNRPDLTAQKFVADPFREEGRLYRTGDFGRWLPDGNLEYLGRMDDQVKVRGFRIELGEVENVLQQYETVAETAVIVKDDPNGNKRLVAYLCVKEGYVKEEMLSWLKGVLPEYMIPSFFITMDQFPLTSNGKVDRKGLPDPDANAMLVTAYVAPRTPLQEQLVLIWQEMLEVPNIGIHDDFFELGGLSLLVIGLISVIRKEIGVKVQVRDIFNYPTIDALSAVITERLENPDADRMDALPLAVHEHLIPLNEGPVLFPVFMLPGAAGVSEVYSALGLALQESCILYGLQMPGVLEGEIPSQDIPEIAALNIRWIKEVQPHGPYRFIGHSLGGIVLYEMIKQLEAAGEVVESGVILDKDTSTDSSFHEGGNQGETLFKLAMLVFELGSFLKVPYPEWVWEMKQALSLSDRESIMPVITELVMKHVGSKGAYSAFMLRILNLVISNGFLEYQLSGKVDAGLLVVKAAETRWEESHPDAELGWTAFSDDVKEITVPGDHDSLVGNANVHVLAAKLMRHFQQFKK
ncbi:hypothetical protein DBR43_00780 [Pedobacter sp. KBW06]|uniref:non-ribosomal peptide synthase/polyketide synthase n=1 Tax=Pedobacter sp. KBW06 TaxID=2153359 RepID=UPI000F598960|nr:non-ribosomal peptide synthase/polyketide synthase [Pedobacter sp. KBW06]RQO73975.1 hypothetical protein DBR43_00780 [Pedobacter sp. KBW06]